jgi:glycosyltransferase involved in cell wall biosynthesis
MPFAPPERKHLGILVCLHDTVLGGDIINAIDMAARLRDRGHRVNLFVLLDRKPHVSHGVPWVLSRQPALKLARERGVPMHVWNRPAGVRAGANMLYRIGSLVRTHGVDVVHSFGDTAVTRWMLLGAGITTVPLVVNDYKMQVSPGHPRRVPLVVGTRRLQEEVAATRPGPTVLIEPPVDVVADGPHAVGGGDFRRFHGVADEETVVAIISRFDRYMKLPGIAGAIEAMGRLNSDSVRLVLVGGGEAEAEVRTRAEAMNRRLGRPAVLVADAMADPRPAYAAADIVLGMGHSALRAAAFAKPVIVLGEGTFSLPLTPETMDHFTYEGFYGHSEGGDIGAQLAQQLLPLIGDRAQRDRLGAFGRRLVLQRYSLDVAVDRLEATYREAIRNYSWSRWFLDAAQATARRAFRGIREASASQ